MLRNYIGTGIASLSTAAMAFLSGYAFFSGDSILLGAAGALLSAFLFFAWVTFEKAVQRLIVRYVPPRIQDQVRTEMALAEDILAKPGSGAEKRKRVIETILRLKKQFGIDAPGVPDWLEDIAISRGVSQLIEISMDWLNRHKKETA